LILFVASGNRWHYCTRDYEQGSVMATFSVGDRVLISPEFFWAKRAAGTISTPPPEVTTLSGPWDDDLTRQERGALGEATPLMIASPSIAIDLPLKVLVWADAEGKAWISYNAPAYLETRHQLPRELVQNLAVVAALARAAAE
jgi:hypothetical protein